MHVRCRQDVRRLLESMEMLPQMQEMSFNSVKWVIRHHNIGWHCAECSGSVEL